MTALENTLWISNLNLNLCVCIRAHIPVCVCVCVCVCVGWHECVGAVPTWGQRALNKIKEFSKKLTKWDVDPAVCLRRRLSEGWRRSGIWGWAGQGHRGTWDSLWVTASEVTPVFLPFVSPFNLQYAMSNNIPPRHKRLHPCCLTRHLIWCWAVKSDFLWKEVKQIQPGGLDHLICLQCKSFFKNCNIINCHSHDSAP